MAKKIIVIGSGFGGLAASLRMKAKGYEVTLVEKHPDLGGRARVFRKGDFTYDGGPTVITAPYLFEELFNLFNKKISNYVKIVPLDLWYRFVFSNGQTFDYSGNEKSMEQITNFYSKIIYEIIPDKSLIIASIYLIFGLSERKDLKSSREARDTFLYFKVIQILYEKNNWMSI